MLQSPRWRWRARRAQAAVATAMTRFPGRGTVRGMRPRVLAQMQPKIFSFSSFKTPPPQISTDSLAGQNNDGGKDAVPRQSTSAVTSRKMEEA
ncbi:hypothetical protein M433DRAFT_372121 [Acidomyces richmondensis BFW]|nr:MAG: hypothetical protein FE78DRAFT_506984 [Acidomyces sp. 'richmondensis']KYG43125.1 hypothetical protein M433DRAFT_372121 [Acidomyces richmondensis BFW]